MPTLASHRLERKKRKGKEEEIRSSRLSERKERPYRLDSGFSHSAPQGEEDGGEKKKGEKKANAHQCRVWSKSYGSAPAMKGRNTKDHSSQLLLPCTEPFYELSMKRGGKREKNRAACSTCFQFLDRSATPLRRRGNATVHGADAEISKRRRKRKEKKKEEWAALVPRLV